MTYNSSKLVVEENWNLKGQLNSNNMLLFRFEWWWSGWGSTKCNVKTLNALGEYELENLNVTKTSMNYPDDILIEWNWLKVLYYKR